NVWTIQRYGLISSSSLSLADGALYALGDEGSIELSRVFGWMMRDDKHRHVERMLAIPTLRVIIGSSATHNRPDYLSRLIPNLGIDILARTRCLCVTKIPVKQSHSAFAHRQSRTVIRPSNEAIQRGCNIEDNFSHFMLLYSYSYLG